MFVRRKTVMEYQDLRIAELENDIKTFKELLELKNKLVEAQENQMYDLRRQNRLLTSKVDNLTCKLDNLTARQEGMVVAYG